MKVLVLLAVIVAFAAAAPAEDLDTLFAVDYEAIYADDDLRQAQFDCLLEKAPCDQKFREAVGKVIKTDCAECNPEQKKKYEHLKNKVMTEYKTVYDELIAKYKA